MFSHKHISSYKMLEEHQHRQTIAKKTYEDGANMISLK